METKVHSVILHVAELEIMSGHGKIITLEVTVRERSGGGKAREERKEEVGGKRNHAHKRRSNFLLYHRLPERR